MASKWLWIGFGAVVLVAGAIALVNVLNLAPEQATEGEGHMDFQSMGMTESVLKSGAFSGADRVHRVSGNASIIEVDGAHFLRFEDYDQTQGPDVFVYLTPSNDPDSKAEIEEEGLRILIDGGADGGESTKTGDFDQELPAGFDPSRYNGIAIWCDQFNQLFGNASLA